MNKNYYIYKSRNKLTKNFNVMFLQKGKRCQNQKSNFQLIIDTPISNCFPTVVRLSDCNPDIIVRDRVNFPRIELRFH